MRTRQWLKAIRYVSYRIVVAGEMDIGFSSNRVQQASYPMPNSYRSRGEFGIREIRYVNYRYAVAGESAIHFLSILAQKTIVSYHKFT